MKLHVIDTGFFKLDGGAMFGVVPKSLWNRHIQADEHNLCNWAARCLLIEDGSRLILVDTGLGDKQSEKFFSYYYRSGDATLLSSIRQSGFLPGDITDVILTHLHFDHVGGAVKYENGKTALTFQNAQYWTSRGQWDWAVNPNAREKASFLTENILPIQEAGRINFIEPDKSPFENISFLSVNGHTEQMILPLIRYSSRQILFAADLFPSTVHLPVAWVMGYDVRPLVTMEEKQIVLKKALEDDILLMFEHDATYEAATVRQGDRGIEIAARGKLSEFI